jgi:transposase
MGGKRLTDQEIERMAQMRKDGLAFHEIAKQFGCAFSTVSRVLKPYGLTVPVKSRKYMSHDTKMFILGELGAGESVRDVADAASVSDTAVYALRARTKKDSKMAVTPRVERPEPQVSAPVPFVASLPRNDIVDGDIKELLEAAEALKADLEKRIIDLAETIKVLEVVDRISFKSDFLKESKIKQERIDKAASDMQRKVILSEAFRQMDNFVRD